MFQSQPIQRRLLTPWFWPPGALTSPERGRARGRGRGWPLVTGVTCRVSPGSPSPASPWSGSRSFCDEGCSQRVRDDRVVTSTGLWLRKPLVLHPGRQCLRRGCTDRGHHDNYLIFRLYWKTFRLGVRDNLRSVFLTWCDIAESNIIIGLTLTHPGCCSFKLQGSLSTLSAFTFHKIIKRFQ